MITDKYKLEFEELPKKARKSGRVNKMTKNNNEAKTSKKYQKTRGEHIKDILIAVLITTVIAFIGGMQFQNQQNAAIDRAVQAVSTPKVEAKATPLK
ncbi:hypothetical protein BH23PAT2_BH23PAT2_07640 [soil metagenome]